MDPLALLYGWLSKSVTAAVSKRVSTETEKFATRALIKGRVDRCVAKVVDHLEPFFHNEGLSQNHGELLVTWISLELEPFINDPKLLLHSSLDGQKLFENHYQNRQLPQAIREEQLDHQYSLLFPRIAHLICRIPGIVEQWQKEAWTESFSRLDDLANAVGEVSQKVDELYGRPKEQADTLFARLSQNQLQRVAFSVDLTGLRGDRPEQTPMEQMFVLPSFQVRKNDLDLGVSSTLVATEEENLKTFLEPRARFTIIAGGGAGKSTWALWLQQRALSKARHLAVSIRLRDFADKPLPSLSTLIKTVAGIHMESEVTAQEIRRWIDSGALAFTIDGFDEVMPERRDEVLSWILELDQAVETCPIMVTTRPLTTNHLARFQQWLSVDLLPFDNQKVTEYIKRWYLHAPVLRDDERGIDCVDLALQWQSDHALSHLTGNPLMLATLLMVHHLDGALPRGRSKLYERYIDGMLGVWDDRRHLSVTSISIRKEEKYQLLLRIALKLHFVNEEQMEENELRSVVQSALHDLNLHHNPQTVIDVLQERSGLLVGPVTYGFVHKTVGEYLVAKAVLERQFSDENSRTLDRFRLFDERSNDRWNSVIFFWVGLAPTMDVVDFLRQLSISENYSDASLAIGIIYDQLERLDSTALKPLFLQSLRVDASEANLTKLNHIVVAKPHDLEASIRCDFPATRSFGNSSNDDMFSSVITKLKLRWNELSASHQIWLNILWIQKLKSPLDESDWKNLLFDKPSLINDKTNWQLFVLYYGIEKTSLQGFVDNTVRIELFCQWFPNYRLMVGCSLLSSLWEDIQAYISLSDYPEIPFERGTVEYVTHSLQEHLALNCKFGMLVDETWLLRTYQYDNGFANRNRTYDLYEHCESDLRKIVQQGVIVDGTLLNEFFNLLSVLRSKRPPSLSNQHMS